jgi:PTH2 family peptidyl-tRNA hydrolase
MSDTKQVIVVRKYFPDGKGGKRTVRSGKIVAQACHATLAFLTRKLQHISSSKFEVRLSKEEQDWINSSYAKVCLQVDTEEELIKVYEAARSAGLEAHLITDSGRTEFSEPTKTCVAIGPDKSERIDKITGDLKLF